MSEKPNEHFDCWAIVEIMGHVIIAGKVTEQTIAGAPLLRIDVPAVEDREPYTKFYGTSAIYCITPTDEETARAAVAGLRTRPIDVWKLNIPQLQAPARNRNGELDYDEIEEWEEDR